MVRNKVCHERLDAGDAGGYLHDYQLSLFLFRRDLRLEDNTGLIFALKHSKQVIPAFIFTPEQIEENTLFNEHCFQFMLESLKDLETQLSSNKGTLYFFQGKPEQVIQELLSQYPIEAVIVNRDYTPYSCKRDKAIKKTCNRYHVVFHCFDDALLNPPEEIYTKVGKPYTIFTPYFKNALKHPILPIQENRNTNYFQGIIPFSKESILSKMKKPIDNTFKGGRAEGLKLLQRLKYLTHYETLRDFPIEDASSHLSPYLKFTVLSPREVYFAICSSLGEHHPLLRSLYWRDFFAYIIFFFPYVLNHSFHLKFDQIEWSYDEKLFETWCEGSTGFPIVDAGMRQLNQTGLMPNRVRMIAASLLVKDLHIDWRLGEKYFAKKLLDYDPALNNGNWQWVASTGCDAQPYFRIFNPWNQQKKFDRECLYIKRWIPELQHLPPEVIHQWSKEKYHGLVSYPFPCVVHEREAKKALVLYKNINQ